MALLQGLQQTAATGRASCGMATPAGRKSEEGRKREEGFRSPAAVVGPLAPSVGSGMRGRLTPAKSL